MNSRSRLLRCLLRIGVALVVLAPMPDLHAQRTLQVSGAPCEGCRIERRRVVEIAGRDEPTIGPYMVVARDSRGRWLLGTMDRSPGVVAVYDSAGTLLQRFSRKGQGPGEQLGTYVLAVTTGDTVHVFDNSLRRYTVLSPTYSYVRSSSYPGYVFGAVEWPDGSRVVNATFQGATSTGLPLHRIDGSGRPVRSFGAEVRSPPDPYGGVLMRGIAAGGPGQIWSVTPLRYEPILWSADGKVMELQRMARWFPPQVITQSPGRGKPPSPRVGGVWHDGLEHLWVVIQVPDANWRLPPDFTMPQGELGPPIEWDREYDTIIEIINTRTGQLVATQRYGEMLGQLLPGGYISHYREDADGEPYLAVWQLSFVAGPGR